VIAPEICVEVISPRNSPEEMAEKRALYFAAGADEVWFAVSMDAVGPHVSSSSNVPPLKQRPPPPSYSRVSPKKLARSRSERLPEAACVARGCDPCWNGWSPATRHSHSLDRFSILPTPTSGSHRVKKESSSKDVERRRWNRRPETACSNTGDTPMLLFHLSISPSPILGDGAVR